MRRLPSRSPRWRSELQPKFSADVYRALKKAGYSNRKIARELGVNEASVRRALQRPTPGAGPLLTALIDQEKSDAEIGRAVRRLVELLK